MPSGRVGVRRATPSPLPRACRPFGTLGAGPGSERFPSTLPCEDGATRSAGGVALPAPRPSPSSVQPPPSVRERAVALATCAVPKRSASGAEHASSHRGGVSCSPKWCWHARCWLSSVKALLLLGAWLSGCSLFPTVGAVAQARAATDLNCPLDRISTYGAGGGVVVARGCDAWTEYTCFSSRTGPVCIREAPARVTRDSGVEK